jgi:hypothetical protein
VHAQAAEGGQARNLSLAASLGGARLPELAAGPCGCLSAMRDRRLCSTSMHGPRLHGQSKCRLLPIAASTRDSAANGQSRELRPPSCLPTRNPPQGIRAAAANKSQSTQALISPACIILISTPQSSSASHPSNRPLYIEPYAQACHKCRIPYAVSFVSLTQRADGFRANNITYTSRIPILIEMLRNYTGPLHWG